MAKAIGYIRVSTEEQAQSGLGLADQEAKIRDEAERRGYELVAIVSDAGYSAKNLKRPSLIAALDELDAGNAQVLIASKLDRLSRSVADFTGLMVRAEKKGWQLSVLDLGLDTSTPNGKFMAHVLVAAAQLERELIGQRTRTALRVARNKGTVLGRKRQVSEEIYKRIASERASGLSLYKIAAGLNADGIPTAHGGAKWYASTVTAIAKAA